jgi:hypothetical protein
MGVELLRYVEAYKKLRATERVADSALDKIQRAVEQLKEWKRRQLEARLYPEANETKSVREFLDLAAAYYKALADAQGAFNNLPKPDQEAVQPPPK